jgi:hypothetical protein
LTPGVQDGDGALDDGAVLQAVDVSGVKGVGEVTDLGAGPVAGNALAIFGLELNLEFNFSRSRCQWRRLDLNLQPWDDEESVLPLCYRRHFPE